MIKDVSCQPPQYGIQLVGASNLRFTERPRLLSTQPAPSAPANGVRQRTALRGECPCCSLPLSREQLRHLAPNAFLKWEQTATDAWLRRNAIIHCPYPSCGAAIQRLPADARAASGAASGCGRGAAGAAGGGGRVPFPAAHAHREAHRYRCGACSRNFCDACRAMPYHEGYTCGEAAQPDCLMCGSKVTRRSARGRRRSRAPPPLARR